MSKGTILLCAGGTGGHLFPAQALASEMIERGYKVHLATDERAGKFIGEFPAEKTHIIKSATFGSKNPLAILKTIFTLVRGHSQSKELVRELQPKAVVGFGGYPTVPPLWAATNMNVPTMIHEANAVLGRANRLLSQRVDKIAVGFGKTKKIGEIEIIVTGNPVRSPILNASKKSYAKRAKSGAFNLLVFGGSQGAAYFSMVLPDALKLIKKTVRDRIRLVQQAREEDLEQVKADYKELGIEATVAPFFSDMDKHLADAHLVISRAGASTVSELAVVGRPAILVPYPHALDHDQANNAATMCANGGGWIMTQAELSAQKLADELTTAIENPKTLEKAAKLAKQTGRSDATTALADLLESIIK